MVPVFKVVKDFDKIFVFKFYIDMLSCLRNIVLTDRQTDRLFYLNIYSTDNKC